MLKIKGDELFMISVSLGGNNPAVVFEEQVSNYLSFIIEGCGF
jgi:hypothetical protein